MTKTKTADIDALSFEDAMQELETIVRNLEEGQVKLDDAVSAYERGAALQKHCQKQLDDAQLKLQKISQKANGDVAAETVA